MSERDVIFFFFQAEDGIRDYKVMEFRRVLFRSHSCLKKSCECGLPLRTGLLLRQHLRNFPAPDNRRVAARSEAAKSLCLAGPRSEERRVGKECRSRWSPYH